MKITFQNWTTLFKNHKSFWQHKAHINYDDTYFLHLIGFSDHYFNQLHLASFSGLMNDPNNLAYFNNQFHIWYQWAPFAPVHQNKHMGHYTTTNFVDFYYQNDAIVPDCSYDRDGVYSGGAIVDQNNYYLFYTGNVKAHNDQLASSFSMIKQWDLEINHPKKMLFEVDHNRYTRNFRDPRPVKINDHYYLLHGAQRKEDMKGCLVVYQSQFVTGPYQYRGEVQFVSDDLDMDFGFMIECPEFMVIDQVDCLIFSTQGKNYYQDQNRDVSIVLLGIMDWNELIFCVSKQQIIDQGMDFYAPQLFNNTPTPIMLAWAGVPQDHEHHTYAHMWAHNLTWPRILSVTNNHLYQNPHPALENLRLNQQAWSDEVVLSKRLADIHLEVVGNHFELAFTSSIKPERKLVISYANNHLVIDRSMMDVAQLTANGLKWTKKCHAIKNLQIILDKSLLELFVNDGQSVFCFKYYLTGNLKIYSKNLWGFYHQLRPINLHQTQLAKVVLLPGETLIDQFTSKDSTIDVVGGAPLNVAATMKKWHHKCYLLGSVGDDAYGKLITNKMQHLGLSLQYLDVDPTNSTTIAQVNLDETGERSFQFLMGTNKINTLAAQELAYDCLVLSSAFALKDPTMLEAYQLLCADAVAQKKLIVFDPNYREAIFKNEVERWRNLAYLFFIKATVIKLSWEEADLFFNVKLSEAELVAKIQQWNCPLVVITAGSRGVLVITPTQSRWFETITVKQIDSTGAGDAFLGALVSQLLLLDINWQRVDLDLITNALLRANVTGALVTTKKGGLTSLPELLQVNTKWISLLETLNSSSSE